jgi:hypothetical protein
MPNFHNFDSIPNCRVFVFLSSLSGEPKVKAVQTWQALFTSSFGRVQRTWQILLQLFSLLVQGALCRYFQLFWLYSMSWSP